MVIIAISETGEKVRFEGYNPCKEGNVGLWSSGGIPVILEEN